MSRIFGPMRQNGYVVRDIEKAMQHYISLGIGPWWYLETVKVEDFKFRGQPGHIEMSIALANAGDLQLELIQQRNDQPSLYKEFLDRHGEGLQHMSAWSHELEAEHERILKAGFRVGHEGRIGANRFIYYDTEGDHPSTTMELYDVSNGVSAFFDTIREAASNWDGKDPIRRN